MAFHCTQSLHGLIRKRGLLHRVSKSSATILKCLQWVSLLRRVNRKTELLHPIVHRSIFTFCKSATAVPVHSIYVLYTLLDRSEHVIVEVPFTSAIDCLCCLQLYSSTALTYHEQDCKYLPVSVQWVSILRWFNCFLVAFPKLLRYSMPTPSLLQSSNACLPL